MDEPSSSAHAAALARRLDRPVVLVGMMGVGKTSLGRKLAAAFGWPFADADEEIEAAAQMTIPEIFAIYGEAYFRDGERRVIARLLGADPSLNPQNSSTPQTRIPQRRVIATGGGAFCNPETRALILARAVAVWIDADLDTLVERTSRKNNRPLLREGDPRATLKRLRDERTSFYAQAPVHATSGNGPLVRTLGLVLDGLERWLDAQADMKPEMP